MLQMWKGLEAPSSDQGAGAIGASGRLLTHTALHLPEDGKEQPQARDEHLQRGVQAPEVRRDLRRAVGAARRDELGDLVDGDALRLRGL
eukprot:CAMPEP_0177603346 /NCGR_PEP_ID=MMETSP0419_2-20121207/15459_1 /TAXON_ID=582737 /ORGANISM="Tetraselmis sp., Strain GSL018" /LENGTH=88 /DNA_ID=CAMNT_0019097103 /DNA_START=541 /DNA_END=804 /DNA_ORIENTATION=-